MEWGHGGDVKGYTLEYGKKPLDFSANVSPLGMPEGVKRAVIESLERGAEYPDPMRWGSTWGFRQIGSSAAVALLTCCSGWSWR